MKFLTNIDLNKNQLLNATIQNLTTDPAAGNAGLVYFNTTDKKLRIHNGTKWENAGVLITDATAGDGIISVDGADITVYTHPNAGPSGGAASGLYKVTVDERGHVTSVEVVTKDDITALGIPVQDTKVSNLIKSTGKVVTGLANNTTLQTTDVKDLTVDGITAVSGGYVSDGATLGAALTALDAAVKNAVAGGGEVNQNAFSNVKVGTITIAADSKTDTLELAVGDGITLTPDATNDKVTIGVTADTYAPKSHNHAAGDITSGTFAVARIPSLTLSKISDVGTAAAKDAASAAIADGSTDAGLVSAAQVAQYVANKTAGLTGAMHFIGISTTIITDGGTENPTIADYTGTAKTAGNVVLYENKEFLWTGSAWELLGDEGSYALKTTTVNGKALSGNITLTAEDVGADEKGAATAVKSSLDEHTGDTTIHITATERTTWNAKQAAISDLATIRSGAEKGSTSVQMVTGTLTKGATTVDVAFTGTFVGATVRDATTGEVLGADVAVGTNKVTVTIAAAYTNNLTITVQYK